MKNSQEIQKGPVHKGPSTESTDIRSKELLAIHMAKAQERLSEFLDTQGIGLISLGAAMDQFTRSVFDLPQGAACKQGCDYCCHLKVGVSIPEVLVIFNALASQTTPEGFEFLKHQVQTTAQKGNTLEDAFWLETRTPCPFLDIQGSRTCLIYALRPFSCRAYNSTDLSACQKSFEQGTPTLIPCFSLYRASTDMYATIFTRVLAEKGFSAFQVGFVKALDILMHHPNASEQWLNREDVFARAKLISTHR